MHKAKRPLTANTVRSAICFGVLAAASILWGLYLWHGSAGVAAQHRLKWQQQQLQDEKQEWVQKTAALDDELKRWEREPLFMVEKVARESYDYAAPDEVVFLVGTVE